MYFVYVLKSEKDNKLYTGYTYDLENRFKQHISGYVNSTKHRLPVQLIYYEACLNQEDAIHREKYLKSTYGKRYLRNRLKHYFNG